MSNFDEDYRRTHPNASITKYFKDAWPDFIEHQLVPFGDLPVYLGIGNHELVAPMTRGMYIAQFADWLNQPMIQRQRLADDPANHLLTTYYHWILHGVDFITMDNASTDMFDSAQMSWFKTVSGERCQEQLDQAPSCWACMLHCPTAPPQVTA